MHDNIKEEKVYSTTYEKEDRAVVVIVQSSVAPLQDTKP